VASKSKSQRCQFHHVDSTVVGGGGVTPPDTVAETSRDCLEAIRLQLTMICRCSSCRKLSSRSQSDPVDWLRIDSELSVDIADQHSLRSITCGVADKSREPAGIYSQSVCRLTNVQSRTYTHSRVHTTGASHGSAACHADDLCSSSLDSISAIPSGQLTAISRSAPDNQPKTLAL
jgi:hypothetical protein